METSLYSIVSYPIWDDVIGGNKVSDYAFVIWIFVTLMFVFQVFQRYLVWRLQKAALSTDTDIDDTAVKIVELIKPPFYLSISLYLALQSLSLSELVDRLATAGVIILITYQSVNSIHILLNCLLEKYILENEDDSAKGAVKAISSAVKGLLWAIGILLVLQNIGVNVSSVLAGLGVGGVAIAFALKEILADLFSSFAIVFDKPFKPGDFIIVGDSMGTVQKIGLKTTRLKALQGEELVISNQELTSSRIQNFKRMRERRIQFSFGVAYETKSTKLAKIPSFVRGIIKKQKNARVDRVNLKSFRDSDLEYEVVYYADTPDYNEYMKIQESINLSIINKFEKEKIDFAYPTRSVILKK